MHHTYPIGDIIPLAPQCGSAIEQVEITEILNKQAAAPAAALALVSRDNDTEDVFMFLSVLGPAWDLTELPMMKLPVEQFIDIDRSNSRVKKYFFTPPGLGSSNRKFEPVRHMVEGPLRIPMPAYTRCWGMKSVWF